MATLSSVRFSVQEPLLSEDNVNNYCQKTHLEAKMKIIEVEKARVIASNKDSIHNYFAWPTVARLKDGKIAVVASGFRLSHVCPFGKVTLSISENNGKTYNQPCPIIDTPIDDRDGGICAFGTSSVIVTSFGHSADFYRARYSTENTCLNSPYKDYVLSYLDTISEDVNERFVGPKYRISHDNGITFGEIKKCPVMSPHGPTPLPDGGLIWVGTLYDFELSHDQEKAKNMVRSYKLDPKTEEFYEIGRMSFAEDDIKPCEVHAIALDSNRIIAQIRINGRFCIYQSESSDGGINWSTPHAVNPDHDGAPPFLLKHSSGALISLYGHRTEPCGIKVMISLDDGSSWSDGVKIYETHLRGDNSFDLGYPSAIELEDGSILTVFYARTDDGSHAEILQCRWRLEI